MDDARYRIRTMTREEVHLAVEWAAREGWNPGLHDAAAFHAADPQGFLIGLLDDEPVATLSAVRYGRDFGFMGFYIVAPEHRGKGYGFRLWQAGLERLAGINTGLDGVLARQDDYRKSGFTLAYRNIRFEGKAPDGIPDSPGIVPLSGIPRAELEAYDRRYFPASRAAFLGAWIRQPATRALAVVGGGRLTGYGVIRPCRLGHKIGPLFADDPELAGTLFHALASRVDGTVYLDVPEVNRAAIGLAERNGMSAVFETARMYTGSPPALALDGLFGVTTFELG